MRRCANVTICSVFYAINQMANSIRNSTKSTFISEYVHLPMIIDFGSKESNKKGKKRRTKKNADISSKATHWAERKEYAAREKSIKYRIL